MSGIRFLLIVLGLWALLSGLTLGVRFLLGVLGFLKFLVGKKECFWSVVILIAISLIALFFVLF